MNLQLVSLEFCILCRSVSTLHLTVKRGISTKIWEDINAPDGKAKRQRCTRIPTLRPRKVTWRLPESQLARCSRALLDNVEHIILDSYYIPGRTENTDKAISWPPSLQKLTFGSRFEKDIRKFEFPMSLQQLVFASNFNQPIGKVMMPESLEILSFGGVFNLQINGVTWPALLRQLVFGSCFNQPVNGVTWPLSHRYLKFGCYFNQPMDGVALPMTLEQLEFGYYLTQPMDGVTLPLSLQKLTFRGDFKQLGGPSGLKTRAGGSKAYK